ncbi:MAG: hypothetical protein ACREHE_15910 [Rhizomicrobium sp.]
MKRFSMAACAAAAVFLAGQGAAAQGARSDPHMGVFGLLNPDGTFKPLTTPQFAPAALSAKTWNGTLTATITISVASTLPSGTTVHCGLNASVGGVAPNGAVDSVYENDQVTATGSGSTLTCHLSIPYQWLLFASTAAAELRDTVQVGYQVIAVNASGDGRLTTASIATLSLPAPGVTTNFTVSARI